MVSGEMGEAHAIHAATSDGMRVDPQQTIRPHIA